MTASRGERLTVARALEVLLHHRRAGNFAEATIDLEQRSLPKLLARLDRPLARTTRADVERLLAERAAEVGPASRARELGALRVLYRVLRQQGLLEPGVDPTAGLVVRVPKSTPRILSEDAVARLLATASQPITARRSPALNEAVALRNRAALELLYGLGLRVSEACALRLLDLDLPAGVALVRRAKRGKPGPLPLPGPVVPHLQAYLARGRPHLLRNRDLTEGRLLANERGRPLTPNHLERLLARIADRAGLGAQGVHPHMLRRSVASHMVRAGASLPAVRHFLGHRLLETTQRYVAVDLDDLRAAVDTLEAVSVSASSAATVPRPAESGTGDAPSAA